MTLAATALVLAVSTASAPRPELPQPPPKPYQRPSNAYPAHGTPKLKQLPFVPSDRDTHLKRFWFWVWFQPLPDEVAPQVGTCVPFPDLRETICEKGCQP